MSESIIVKMREQGTKEWEERSISHINNLDLAVEWFAEEWGIDDGGVVEVFRRGKFKIRTEEVVEFYATEI